MKVTIITTINVLFTSFIETFQKFKNRSRESKYDDISKLYKALKEFEKHKITTDETEKRKTRVVNNTAVLYSNYFDSYEKTYNESALNEKEGCNSNQFKIADDVLPEWLESKNRAFRNNAPFINCI